MKVYVKKVDNLTLPKKGSNVAAGYDIVATSDPKIVGEQVGVNWSRIDYIEYETNLYIAPSVITTHTLIHPRSSISKYNLVLANSIGLVDNDYRGMVICRFKYVWQPEDFKYPFPTGILGNVNDNKIYKKGDTIAQLVFEPTIQVEFELVDDLTKTQRGEGGFGSTDVLNRTQDKVSSKPFETSTLVEKYSKSGGIQIKERYSEEVKNREN